VLASRRHARRSAGSGTHRGGRRSGRRRGAASDRGARGRLPRPPARIRRRRRRPRRCVDGGVPAAAVVAPPDDDTGRGARGTGPPGARGCRRRRAPSGIRRPGGRGAHTSRRGGHGRLPFTRRPPRSAGPSVDRDDRGGRTFALVGLARGSSRRRRSGGHRGRRFRPLVTERGARPLVDGYARPAERRRGAGRHVSRSEPRADTGSRADGRSDRVADSDRDPDRAAGRDADGSAHGHADAAADEDAEADEHPEADREAHPDAGRDADTRANANAGRHAGTHPDASATDTRAHARPDLLGPRWGLRRVAAATAPDHSGRGSHALAAATLPLP